MGKTTFFLRLKYDRYIETESNEFTGQDHLEYSQVVDGTTVKVNIRSLTMRGFV